MAVTTYRFSLSDLIDPGVDYDHWVRYQFQKNEAGDQVDLVVRLMEGAAEIDSWTHLDIPTTLTRVDQLLPSSVAASISDYPGLEVELEQTALDGSDQYAIVTWHQMQVPPAAAELSATATGRGSTAAELSIPNVVQMSAAATGRGLTAADLQIAVRLAASATGRGLTDAALGLATQLAASATGKGTTVAVLNVGVGTQEADVIIAHLRPNEIAPGGVGGEALFSALYFALEYDTDVRLTITPIVDGEILTAEQTTVTRFWSGGTPQREAFEIGFSRDHDSQSRQGLRGTWFTVDITVEDTGNTGGNVAIEGLEVEYESAREQLPHKSYTAEILSDVVFSPIGAFMFGHMSTGEILEFGVGSDDDGTEITAQATPNWIAPAGSKGVCLFTTLYLTITRENDVDLTMDVTPILDGEELTTETLTFPAVTGRIAEVREVPLSRLHGASSRYGLRGTFFTFRWETSGAVPDAHIALDGAELEYEPIREDKVAVNAT